jgi:hypothetical protein
MPILLVLLYELSGQLDDTFITFYEQTNRQLPTRFLGRRFRRVWTWIGQFSPMHELTTRFLHPLHPWRFTLATGLQKTRLYLPKRQNNLVTLGYLSLPRS